MKEDDLRRFGRVKAGYEPINRSTIKKPKSASLWFDDGAVKKKLENNNKKHHFWWFWCFFLTYWSFICLARNNKNS